MAKELQFTQQEAKNHLARNGKTQGDFYFNVFAKKFNYYTLNQTKHTKKFKNGKPIIVTLKAPYDKILQIK